MRRRLEWVSSAIALATSWTAIAAAADGSLATRFLIPQRYSTPAGQTLPVHIGVVAGSQFRTSPWPAGDLRWLFVRAQGFQQNRDTLERQRGDAENAAVELPHAGVNMIGIDFKRRVETVTAAELRQFLEKHALPDVQKRLDGIPADQAVRVLRIESTKLLVKVVGDEGQEACTVATSKSGQAVEIRALADPTHVPVGGDLPLRLYADGDKCGEVRVLATHVGSAATHDIAVDKGAFANLTISAAGLWRVEFCKAEPAGESERADADWVIWTASLSFETPAQPDDQGGQK